MGGRLEVMRLDDYEIDWDWADDETDGFDEEIQRRPQRRIDMTLWTGLGMILLMGLSLLGIVVAGLIVANL